MACTFSCQKKELKKLVKQTNLSYLWFLIYLDYIYTQIHATRLIKLYIYNYSHLWYHKPVGYYFVSHFYSEMEAFI